MRPVDIKKLSYRDELARKNHLFFILKVGGALAILALVIGGGTYFIFFTDKLEIKDITINGLETVEQEVVLAEINKQSESIILFNTDTLEAGLLSVNPVLKSVQAGKHLPHRLVVDIVERQPAGIWCAGTPPAGGCRYFDKEMQTWGPAVRSSGFLLLAVEDSRPKESFGIDADFFRAIHEAASNLLGLTVRSVVIPENSFDEFRIYTDRSFYLVFSLDTDIKSQLDVLRIFLEEKSKDPPPAGGFAPQYIDLRIEGRVYFK